MQEILDRLIVAFPELAVCRDDIFSAYNTICKSYENGGKLLVCGNGGSAADADHIVGELMKGFLLKRELPSDLKDKFTAAGCSELANGLQMGLPAISLCAHSALMTAFSNDCESSNVFAQQVLGYGRNGDTLIALSTSGNSENVVRAVEVAAVCGVRTISITGNKESKLSSTSEICIRLPETETYRIQELTLPVYHCLCAMVEKYFFG